MSAYIQYALDIQEKQFLVYYGWTHFGMDILTFVLLNLFSRTKIND